MWCAGCRMIEIPWLTQTVIGAGIRGGGSSLLRSWIEFLRVSSRKAMRVLSLKLAYYIIVLALTCIRAHVFFF